MTKSTTIVPVSNIILDEEIYPRNKIDQKRIGRSIKNASGYLPKILEMVLNLILLKFKPILKKMGSIVYWTGRTDGMLTRQGTR
jgi:hypothetical protein